MDELDLEAIMSAPAEAPVEFDSQQTGAVERFDLSPTALVLDKWTLGRGEQLTEAWGREKVIEWGETASEEANAIVADAHGALFEPKPKFSKHPADATRSTWLKDAMQTPEFHALRAQTYLDTYASSIGAKSLVDQYLEYKNSNKDSEDRSAEERPGGDKEPVEKIVERIRSVTKAVKEATEAVEMLDDINGGLGMGEGSPLSKSELAECYKNAQKSKRLRNILAWAGRGKRLMRSLQRKKKTAVRGEVTGIELSGDIGRLIPMELGQVVGVMPELQDRALYRLLRNRSLSYRHKKVEPVQGGPIVIVCDESGSMTGNKAVASKGLALVMTQLATSQNRWTALVGYSGSTGCSTLVIPPRAKKPKELMEWLTHFYGGGSERDVPVKEMHENIWPQLAKLPGFQRGKTDIIMITDAQAQIGASMIAGYKAWAKTENVTTYGITIAAGKAGDFGKITDKLWCVDDLTLETDAVEGVLSI